MLNIRLATENRKAAAERLAEITGAESHYTRVPRCAYEVGLYTIEKDGSITVAEGTDLQPLHTLVKEGLVEPFEAVAPETPPEELTPDADEDETAQEPVELTVEQVPQRGPGVARQRHANRELHRFLRGFILVRVGREFFGRRFRSYGLKRLN